MRSFKKTWVVFLAILAGGFFPGVLHVEEGESLGSMDIELEQNVYFSGPTSESVMVPAGRYAVLPENLRLRLIALDKTDQPFYLISCVLIDHGEKLSVPHTLLIADEGKQHIVVLFLLIL